MSFFQTARSVGLLAAAVLFAGAAFGQQEIKLTIGSHAGPALVPVAVMKNH